MALLPVRPVDPLNHAVPIVDERGHPTPQFMRQWVQSRTVNLVVGDVMISLDALRALVEAAESLLAGLEARQINAGTGLSGGGNLATDVTLNLADTAVTPGTYGSATKVAQITVDQQGRITGVAEVEIT